MSTNFAAQMKAFLGDGICLLVEPSSSFGASLQSCLAEIGIPLSQVATSKKFEEAKKIVEEKKPKLIVTEYDLQPGMGLELIEMQETQYDDNARIGMIVTKNSSDSAVAEAAEGAVDAFLLKPFSVGIFRTKLSDVLTRKTRPSDYQKLLQVGRTKAAANDFEGAIAAFNAAKTRETKPSMACCMAAKIYERQEKWELALAEYRQGRQFQPLHYKCMIGEFEVLSKLKRYADAYEVVGRLRDNYPIPPVRLGEFFTAAVFTYNFADLPRYFEMYLAFENRTPWLTNLVAVGLTAAGKYHLQKKDPAKAMPFFEMGLTARGRDITYVELVFDELMKAEAFKEAEFILSKTLPADVGGKQNNQMRFRIDQRTLTPEQLVERGKRMINEGQGSPEIYRLMVELLAKLGRTTMAESMISTAAKDYPDLRPALYAILAKYPAK